MTRNWTVRFALGFAAGALFWLACITLGVPNVFHVGGYSWMVPSAFISGLVSVTRLWVIVAAAVLGMTLLLLLIAFTPVIERPARAMFRADSVTAQVDAVMVLSAGISDDGLLHPQGADRLIKGIELVKRGIAPELVLSRESMDRDSGAVTSVADQNRFLSLGGIDPRRVTILGVTRSTRQEAVLTARIARQRGWSTIALVSSPFHTRRACRAFEKAGVRVVCVPSESRDIAVNSLSSPDDRMAAFRLWLYETAGTLRFMQLGWL